MYKDGLVHPDLVATKGGDAKQLFQGGKIVFMQDGPGAWQGMQRRRSRRSPPPSTCSRCPSSPPAAATRWCGGADDADLLHLHQEGPAADRVKELLRRAQLRAPRRSARKEFELLKYGKEGTHFTRATDGAPAVTDLAKTEIADQFFFIAGRSPAIIGSPETPNYVKDLLAYANSMIKYLEPNPWQGIKLEWPSAYSAVNQPTEDTITDIVRGRRPVTDLDSVVAEWKTRRRRRAGLPAAGAG